VFCNVFGTAAAPHILDAAYTHAPSVQEAAHFGVLVAGVHLILYLHGALPRGAGEVVRHVHEPGGQSFASLPAWASAWAKVDPIVLNITDIKQDGIVQLAKL